MTPLQRDLLFFIQRYMRAHDGVSPTYREMAAALGWASKSSVARALDSLEHDGLITRGRDRARSIEVAYPRPLASVSVGQDGDVAIHIEPDLTESQREAFRAALTQAEARL